MGGSPFLRYLWEHMLVRRYGLNTIKSRCDGIKSFISFIAGFIWCKSIELAPFIQVAPQHFERGTIHLSPQHLGELANHGSIRQEPH